ncbi:MAG TPA: glutaredoxin family protein [Actinomycetota bacterium]|nr:glutaredoxin family protein [Actinomycetota bacterium]
MGDSGLPDVVLYSRSSCHLCDDAREVILAERERSAFRFREVLVDGDEDLERAYGLRVPVVTVAGTEAFEYTVNPSELRRLVRE